MSEPAQLQYGMPKPTVWERRGMRWVLIVGALLLSGAAVLVMNGRSVRRFVDEKRRLWDDRRRYYETAAETMSADHVVWQRDRDHGQATMDVPGRFELLWN